MNLPSPTSYATAARRLALVKQFDALLQSGCSTAAAAAQLDLPPVTLWRWHQRWKTDPAPNELDRLLDHTDRCGRKPAYTPTQSELEIVRSIYLRLDESDARGRGLGSSKVAAWRIACRSDEYRDQISDELRTVVLASGRRRVPPSFIRLLDLPASVLANHRDHRSTTAAYISTPRSREIIDQDGNTVPLRPGHIFEADDGTLNFYAWIPWPFGGDKCSDRFGVKLARWQLLATVDAASLMCVCFDVVCRPSSAYRAEDSAALIGRTMTDVGVPSLWRLERGSWESRAVRDALAACNVQVKNAWHSKQKAAVENFFDRLWTPASLIPGHVGRDQSRFKQVTNLAVACQDGRRDPRDYFLPLDGAGDAAIPRLIKAIEFTNTEPVESRAWGRWVPQDRFTEATAAAPLPLLADPLKIFFSREQKTWTVRQATVGGKVPGPLVTFPIYFQNESLWEFEGTQVKCFFDPYAEPCLGTIILADEWRGFKAGHIIARDVPALDLPPQASLAESETTDQPGSLAIRKAIAKAVRTEMWSWLGQRASRARDGLGNEASRSTAPAPDAASRSARTTILRPSAAAPISIPSRTAEERQAVRINLSRQAEIANRLRELAEVT